MLQNEFRRYRASAIWLSHPANVGLGEVVTLEKQWLGRPEGQGVGGTIAKIQTCPMNAFSKATESVPGDCQLFVVKRHDANRSGTKQGVEVCGGVRTAPSLNNHGSFED